MKTEESGQDWIPPCGCKLAETKIHEELATDALTAHLSGVRDPAVEAALAVLGIAGERDEDAICTATHQARREVSNKERQAMEAQRKLVERRRAEGRDDVQEGRLLTRMQVSRTELETAKERLAAAELLGKRAIHVDDARTVVLSYCDEHLGLSVSELLSELRKPKTPVN